MIDERMIELTIVAIDHPIIDIEIVDSAGGP
jgi:hypothetical protein